MFLIFMTLTEEDLKDWDVEELWWFLHDCGGIIHPIQRDMIEKYIIEILDL